MVAVPVRTNPPTRPSRLFKSNARYIVRTAATTLNSCAIYNPIRVLHWSFLVLSLFGFSSIAIARKWLAMENSAGHSHSIILGGALLLGVFVLIVARIMAEITIHRHRLMEEALERVRRMELSRTNASSIDANGSSTASSRKAESAYAKVPTTR